MINRKRSLKSNTRNITIKNVTFEQAKKFQELMQRTEKETESEAIQVIIDLADSELKQIRVGEKIPAYVIEFRKRQGYGDGNFDIELKDE